MSKVDQDPLIQEIMRVIQDEDLNDLFEPREQQKIKTWSWKQEPDLDDLTKVEGYVLAYFYNEI